MRAAVPAVDRGAFIPGLKPRGHEDVLYATTGELLASLPEPAAAPVAAPAERQLGYDQGLAETTETDQQAVRAFLHRHGHRSER